MENESDKFCLHWNDFETNISSAFRELRDQKDFFDITLACEDEHIQVHKVILAACSPFFRNILHRHPHQHPLLYLKGVKYSDLLSVLNFMYHGEVNVAQEDLNSFLAVAEDLKIKGLTENQTSTPTASNHYSAPNSCPPLPSPEPHTFNTDPTPPIKRSQPTTSSIPSTPKTDNDIDIEEVAPVKLEPGDPLSLPSPQQTYTERNLQSTGDGLTPSYHDKDYEYENDGGYERPCEEGSGAEGHKGHIDLMNMDSLISNTGSGTMCLLCNKVLAYRHDARRHVRMKHSGDNTGINCDLCGKTSKHRWSHAHHMRQKHGQYSKHKPEYVNI